MPHHRMIARAHPPACPAIAAAAAMAGLIRCVRPPLPCRPSKFRFDVEAQRSPGPSTSSFMPRHIEHPGLRHSNPASVKTRSSPSRSAAALHLARAGHDHRAHSARHSPATRHLRRFTQVFDSRVGAGAEKHPIHPQTFERQCRARDPCTPARAATIAGRPPSGRRRDPERVR